MERDNTVESYVESTTDITLSGTYEVPFNGEDIMKVNSIIEEFYPVEDELLEDMKQDLLKYNIPSDAVKILLNCIENNKIANETYGEYSVSNKLKIVSLFVFSSLLKDFLSISKVDSIIKAVNYPLKLIDKILFLPVLTIKSYNIASNIHNTIWLDEYNEYLDEVGKYQKLDNFDKLKIFVKILAIMPSKGLEFIIPGLVEHKGKIFSGLEAVIVQAKNTNMQLKWIDAALDKKTLLGQIINYHRDPIHSYTMGLFKKTYSYQQLTELRDKLIIEMEVKRESNNDDTDSHQDQNKPSMKI